MPMIHPTAVVAPEARIADNVRIGAFCVVGPEVTLDEGVELKSHVVVEGKSHIGARTVIYPFAAIGHAPQDLKYKGEASSLTVGADCMIREYVTIHPGTSGDKMHTEIGHHCLLMVGVHVAHDCVVGNYVIMANNATLAGHVHVGDHVVIGGLSAIHQFVRIGAHAMIGGMSGIEHDVIPYGSAMGERANLAGLNLVGLKRRGFSRESIHQLRHAYKALFESDGTLGSRLERAQKEFADQPEVMELIRFMTNDSSRSYCVPKPHAA
ncbi:acyl-ACP--UDP-N-acetylglucosamine O-acyltransferase [bacterium]|nr:acyl-ACP--UDP-N-acetylglucosamine O-acyltransferase [bacterium]